MFEKRVKKLAIAPIYTNNPAHNKNGCVELCRLKTIDGINFLVTIRLNEQKLHIFGDTKDKRDIKVIEIPRQEALDFIDA
jgi:hypothetical protein